MQRDEKLANGRVNAHQAVLLSSAHLNHYRGENKHILRSKDNPDVKVFSLPFDKVLFDQNNTKRKYALMLNRHKFSMYRLPIKDEQGNNVEGALIWESDITIPNEVDFDGFYAKELRLEGKKLKLITRDNQTSWEVNIPIIEYLNLGSPNNRAECKTFNHFDGLERVCTTRAIRDTHHGLGIENGHMTAQWIEISVEGHMLVKREYTNTGGEILTVTAWSSHEGLVNKFDNVHRHLLREDIYTKIDNPLISALKMKKNNYMESINGNNLTTLIDGNLVIMKKSNDESETWIETSSFKLN